jgi:hypothetical protein
MPEMECAVGAQPEEYGGGGFEYAEGLITAAAAIVFADEYGRSVLIRSIFSRFMMDKIPLQKKYMVSIRNKRSNPRKSSGQSRERRSTFAYSRLMVPLQQEDKILGSFFQVGSLGNVCTRETISWCSRFRCR